MKKINFTFILFLLLFEINAFAQQVPKVIATITETNQLTPFGPNANNYYGFQSYWRTLNIDASGSKLENLVLKMRVYIDNLDKPGDISFIQNAGFAMIELANDQTPIDTYVQWPIKTLQTPLKNGWTDLYLPLSTGDRKLNFDLKKPLNWFRFAFANILGKPDALQIRLKDIQLIDTSILVDPPITTPTDTNYFVGDVPFVMNKPIAKNVTFSVGQSFTTTPINAIAHNPQQLYLMFDANITEQTQGDISVLNNVTGQIELTSSGRPDQNEKNWDISNVNWKPGHNTYTIPFSISGITGGELDLSNINYLRIYGVNVPLDYAGKITLDISNVKIVDLTTQTKLPTLFSDKMMFQQNKPISIWGTAIEGKEIKVNWYKNDVKLDSKLYTVPATGKWKVTFDAQTGGYDKYRIDVLEGNTLIQSVNDILVGEVWLSSGQSNMALKVGGSIDGQTLMANANNDNIRFFLEPTATTAPYVPNTDIQGAYWGSGNVGNQVGKFSAVAYSMAVKLQKELNIPIGILNTAVGGSIIEAWLPTLDIESDSDLLLSLKRMGLYFEKEFYPNGTNQMSSFYNLKINPLLGYNITGMIWYQGESNSARPQLYSKELNLLKKSYERVFGFSNNDMPFIFSQVCPWVTEMSNPQALASLAEAMSDTWAMNQDDMAMLPLYDTDITYVGNVVIHPTNKTPVGRRFATSALNMLYKKSGEYTAPMYESFRISGDTIIVKFNHVGDGLKTINGINNVRGFALSNENGVYVGAKAKIISVDEVAVWNERVKNPQQVTYAWATYNVMSNLSNSVEIPAAPFRSERITIRQNHYNPQDWTFADGAIWGVNASDFVDFIPAWKETPISVLTNNKVTLSYDSVLKSEGKASLKLQYEGSTNGIIGAAGPALSNKTFVSQLANFNTISVDVFNPDAYNKNIEFLMKAADGKIYYATFIGYVGDNSNGATFVNIGKTLKFRTLAFNIKVLKDEQKVIVPANNVDAILSTINAIEFRVSDIIPEGQATTGEIRSIYLDNVIFGFSSEKLTPTDGNPNLSTLIPVDEKKFNIYVADNLLNIKVDSNNLMNKIELFDLQGKKIYSKTGINSTEYSIEILPKYKIYIIKVQTEKFELAKKIFIN